MAGAPAANVARRRRAIRLAAVAAAAVAAVALVVVLARGDDVGNGGSATTVDSGVATSTSTTGGLDTADTTTPPRVPTSTAPAPPTSVPTDPSSASTTTVRLFGAEHVDASFAFPTTSITLGEATPFTLTLVNTTDAHVVVGRLIEIFPAIGDEIVYTRQFSSALPEPDTVELAFGETRRLTGTLTLGSDPLNSSAFAPGPAQIAAVISSRMLIQARFGGSPTNITIVA